MAHTAMSAAMERVGFSEIDVELNVALARYRNKGGTFERLVELARAAYELPGEATLAVPQGHCGPASARQPNGDEEGQPFHAKQATVALPTSSPTLASIRGETIVSHAFRDERGHFLRKPTAAQLRVAAAVAKDAAVTVLDTYRIRDGRPIGDVRIGELEGLRTANAMEASLIRQIQRHAAAESSALVRDVVNVSELQRMIQRAAEVADAA